MNNRGENRTVTHLLFSSVTKLFSRAKRLSLDKFIEFFIICSSGGSIGFSRTANETIRTDRVGLFEFFLTP